MSNVRYFFWRGKKKLLRHYGRSEAREFGNRCIINLCFGSFRFFPTNRMRSTSTSPTARLDVLQETQWENRKRGVGGKYVMFASLQHRFVVNLLAPELFF